VAKEYPTHSPTTARVKDTPAVVVSHDHV